MKIGKSSPFAIIFCRLLSQRKWRKIGHFRHTFSRHCCENDQTFLAILASRHCHRDSDSENSEQIRHFRHSRKSITKTAKGIKFLAIVVKMKKSF